MLLSADISGGELVGGDTSTTVISMEESHSGRGEHNAESHSDLTYVSRDIRSIRFAY